VAPALAVLHFTWRVKRDIREPLTYGVVLAALLIVRILSYLQAHRIAKAPSSGLPFRNTTNHSE
jgi:sulfoxide reductase heme-binding subunit YedZ